MDSEEGERSALLNNRTESSGIYITVVKFILFVELCERLTYHSVVGNLVLFCTSELHLSTTAATTVSLIFSGSVYFVAVTGGYIADAFSGKYRTIVCSGFIAILGLSFLPVSAVDWDTGKSMHNLKLIFFYIGLMFVGIGTGGMKANIGPFGAHQIEDKGSRSVQSYFIWFYWFRNVGAFVSHLGVAYIQQNVNFAYGFLIPLISVIITIIIFVVARNKYTQRPAEGSIILDVVQMIYKARLFNFKRLRRSNGGQYSDQFVSDVIRVLKMFPIFSLLILYWAIYSQMQSTYFVQGERMLNPYIGQSPMPVAVLPIFNDIMIIILLPLADRFVYPTLSNLGQSPSHLKKIGFGFVFSFLSVIAAGVLEIYRKENLSVTGGMNQTIADHTFNASSISVFAQIPQFALIGVSEVFTSVSAIEFAYLQAPENMQGFVMGVFVMTIGMGNYLSTAILTIIKHNTGTHPSNSWFPDEINNGKMEYIFFIFGGLIGVNAVIFVFVAMRFKYKNEPAYDMDEITVVQKETHYKRKQNSRTNT